ncbi:LRR receptor-like serine/threonine-protein kinase ERL1 [Selaginella moellendorffii]|uniref:LRR receptor-like serine/threonine-protein kinase ERL1 n=1 Tax=Selaginella moellendorffii TaxID=88036 RepID=UPI000D1C70BC|nr:LRR receptor-like serine/threonine-protein kinase ERL1 [Selaginella moellendorffii]|eukprot:XP_024521927.1 LRR receptor-like serine/threonine-protein kinase ERL1 [Selaginella moellendorffii]
MDVEILLEFKQGMLQSNSTFSNWHEGSKDGICSWRGISCNSERQVVSIHLSSVDLDEALVGTLTPRLGQLSYLSELDLSLNKITGQIPTTLGNCSSLTKLNLGGNQLTGHTGNIRKHSAFNHSAQNSPAIHGSIPKGISLERLDLSKEVPPLNKCTKLGYLDLHGNPIWSRLPTFGACTNLVYLDLSTNKFQGEISSRLENCSQRKVVNFAQNNFTGEVWLDGSCQATFGSFMVSRATDLNLGIYTGVRLSLVIIVNGVRVQFDRTTIVANNMTSLGISSNSLNGEEIGQLVGLMYLNLSHNQFTGAIPLNLSSLKKLQSLDLSWNMLQGRIPNEFGELPLSAFNVSFNNLSRLVPTAYNINTRSLAFQGNKTSSATKLCGHLAAVCLLAFGSHF